MPLLLRQLLLIVSLGWMSWLGMMLVHEAGHVSGAILTGGHVTRVIWHPAVFSRTDVQPNPSPLVEVWAGPVVGCAVPLAMGLIANAFRLRVRWGLAFFAGFCLIANGLYIGLGAINPIGDARDMLRLHTARWIMLAFGLITTGGGLALWNGCSPHLGFGPTPHKISPKLAYGMFAAAVGITGIAWLMGNRGI